MRTPTAVAIVAAACLALPVGGCGNADPVSAPTPTVTPTQPPATDFMYVADAFANTVTGFTVGSDGSLVQVPGGPLATGGRQLLGIAVDSSKRFLYVVDRLAESVTGFALETQTGRLSPVPGTAAVTGRDPRHIAAHPTLPRLYVANALSHDLTVLGFDSATGAITSSARVPSAEYPTFVDVHPSGRFLYLGAMGRVAMHRIRSDGSLEGVQELRPRDLVAARVLKLSGAGDRLYAYEDGYARLFAFHVDGNTGAITEGAGPRPRVSGFVTSLCEHPSGRYLYLSTLTATLPGYAIDGQLRLTPLPDAAPPLTPGTEDAIVNLEPKGRFAYVFEGVQGTRIVRTCRIDSGSLTTLRTSAIGTYPFATAFVYR
jgi:6-phosphogluconolactonase